VNESVLRHLAVQAGRADVYPSVMFPPSVYYRFLRLLTAYLGPRVSVELGVCGGGASLHMALGYPQGKVFGIDITLEYPDNIEYIKKICPNFSFIQTSSLEAAALYRGPPVGLLFIDTVHTYELCR